MCQSDTKKRLLEQISSREGATVGRQQFSVRFRPDGSPNARTKIVSISRGVPTTTTETPMTMLTSQYHAPEELPLFGTRTTMQNLSKITIAPTEPASIVNFHLTPRRDGPVIYVQTLAAIRKKSSSNESLYCMQRTAFTSLLTTFTR